MTTTTQHLTDPAIRRRRMARAMTRANDAANLARLARSLGRDDEADMLTESADQWRQIARDDAAALRARFA